VYTDTGEPICSFALAQRGVHRQGLWRDGRGRAAYSFMRWLFRCEASIANMNLVRAWRKVGAYTSRMLGRAGCLRPRLHRRAGQLADRPADQPASP
jgi:hypothetical protein